MHNVSNLHHTLWFSLTSSSFWNYHLYSSPLMQESTKFDPSGSWGIFLAWKMLWTLHHWYLIYTSILLTFTTTILATDYWLTGVGKWHCYICFSLAICTPKFSNLDNVSLKSLLFCTALQDTWLSSSLLPSIPCNFMQRMEWVISCSPQYLPALHKQCGR